MDLSTLHAVITWRDSQAVFKINIPCWRVQTSWWKRRTQLFFVPGMFMKRIIIYNLYLVIWLCFYMCTNKICLHLDFFYFLPRKKHDILVLDWCITCKSKLYIVTVTVGISLARDGKTLDLINQISHLYIKENSCLLFKLLVVYHFGS